MLTHCVLFHAASSINRPPEVATPGREPLNASQRLNDSVADGPGSEETTRGRIR